MVWVGLGSFRLPRVVAPQLHVELEKSEIRAWGGAIGTTEARNKLGMLHVVVMSLQLSMAIGGV